MKHSASATMGALAILGFQISWIVAALCILTAIIVFVVETEAEQ